MGWISRHMCSAIAEERSQMANAITFCLILALLPTSYCLNSKNNVYQWVKRPESYQSKGKWLSGHWFFMSWVNMTSQCAYRCLKTPICQSFNFDSTNGKCELNRKTHLDNPSDFVDDVTAREYHTRAAYSINPEALGPCAGDPCNSKGTCIETRTEADGLVALCMCDKGWAGVKCDLVADAPQWGVWEPWGACSVSCGQGWHTRKRNCEDSVNNNTIDPLNCYGRNVEYEACMISACPKWDDWGAWGACSTETSCGRGHKVRHRTCTNGGTPGMDRFCMGPTNQSTACVDINCKGLMRLKGGTQQGEGRVEIFNDLNKEWGLVCSDQWNMFAANLVCKQMGLPGAFDAVTDGSFGNGAGKYGITSLTCTGSERTVQMCKRNPWSLATSCSASTSAAGVKCKVNGVWSLWGSWSSCSVTCADGIEERTRQCNHPPALHGGKPCPGDALQTRPCALPACPSNGTTWLAWGAWSACDVTCGSGLVTRTRDCHNVTTSDWCVGDAVETQSCSTETCAVDGVWMTWESWSACSETCDEGTQQRSRTCDGPYYGGADCSGQQMETQECQDIACPVDGFWDLWQTWGNCSATCGGGQRIRQRKCNPPLHAGSYCIGKATDVAICNTNPCPIDGYWRDWAEWDPCNVTCGGGQQRRERVCVEPQYDGQACNGAAFESRECNTNLCPVDGHWMNWGRWGMCNVTCGGGIQQRSRECYRGQHGGVDCISGVSEEEQACNTHKCPGGEAWIPSVPENNTSASDVNGVWDLWGEWSNCSLACGNGTQTRSRTCRGPFHGGKDCDGPILDVKHCNTHSCAVDGVWASWLSWSSCDVTCGNGTQVRKRTCAGPYFGGKNCSGPWNDIVNCFLRHCPVAGIWQSWASWTSCPVSCGGGAVSRFRSCAGPFHGGEDCLGNRTESKTCGSKPCPIDGFWGSWSPYTSCNTTCGGGIQIRYRNCTPPRYGGNNCTGASEEPERCNENPCPVDGVFQEWTDWSTCSTSCGGGVTVRTRTCTEPLHGGSNCSGVWRQNDTCNTHHCPVDGVWKDWSLWSACDLSCGGGSRSRVRECDGPYFGGNECNGTKSETETCNEFNCPVDGVWDAWSDWDVCSLTCGGGIQWRTRNCTGPFYGGHNCSGSDKESRACNTEHCPVDGYFNAWSPWSDCDVTCGGGIRRRNRTCSEPMYGGDKCDGIFDETETCNTQHCPVDGVFTDWSVWGECSVTCGGGKKWRTRTCVGPFYNGTDCQGPRDDSTSCNEEKCPIDGVYSDWSAWSTCTVTCGGGTQWHNRTCIGPFYGGDPCHGVANETQDCNTQHCPIDGVFSAWSQWDTCTVTCGGGTQSRSRKCTEPQYGGKDCQGPVDSSQDCNTQHCPVDGVYGDWSQWGTCTVTCGGGTKVRNRTCTEPQYGGKDCKEPAEDWLDCNTHHCPGDNLDDRCSYPEIRMVHGFWHSWAEWGTCNVTCGGGARERTRVCEAPKYGGDDCVGPRSEYLVCNENPCPIPGDWFQWEPWRPCSVTCGGGKRKRHRDCDMTSYGDLTAPCIGVAKEIEDCHTFSCVPYAATCTEWGERGLTTSTMADIDPFRRPQGRQEPVLVYCDMLSENGVGVTVIGHDQQEEQEVTGYEGAGEFQLEITYNVTLEQAIAIIDLSESCKQFISWKCKAALIHNPYGKGRDIITTGWRNRTGEIADYFGGGSPGSGKCSCGMSNSCFNVSMACNCDSNDNVWREDSGFLTYKDDLPVVEFIAGDTGEQDIEMGKVKVGNLLCKGTPQ